MHATISNICRHLIKSVLTILWNVGKINKNEKWKWNAAGRVVDAAEADAEKMNRWGDTDAAESDNQISRWVLENTDVDNDAAVNADGDAYGDADADTDADVDADAGDFPIIHLGDPPSPPPQNLTKLLWARKGPQTRN